MIRLHRFFTSLTVYGPPSGAATGLESLIVPDRIPRAFYHGTQVGDTGSSGLDTGPWILHPVRAGETVVPKPECAGDCQDYCSDARHKRGLSGGTRTSPARTIR